MPICTMRGIKCRKVRKVSEVSEVRATPCRKMHRAYTHTQKLTHTHTHAHTPSRDREAPHMAFSSQAAASCSPAQWALPLIVAARPSLYRSHYSGGGCVAHFFCPYHRQSSSPRPGHIPPRSLEAADTLERSVTCQLSTG